MNYFWELKTDINGNPVLVEWDNFEGKRFLQNLVNMLGKEEIKHEN